MAVEAEYGPHLRKLFVPLMTGVGPVEAAVAVGAELAAAGGARRAARSRRLARLGRLPPTLEQTEVYQATSCLLSRHGCLGRSALPRATTPFLDLPAAVPLPLRIPGVEAGEPVDGRDHRLRQRPMTPSPRTWSTWRPSPCCAPARVFGVPLIGLRGISDGAADLKHVDDWTEYLHVIDEKLAARRRPARARRIDGRRTEFQSS